MFKKLLSPTSTVTIQGEEIKLHGLTMQDIADVIEALPDDVLKMFEQKRDLNIIGMVTKFPKVSALMLMKSAKVPPEDIKESMEAISNMGFAHKVMCLTTVWNLTVPDDEALTALKNAVRSLYQQVLKMGAELPAKTAVAQATAAPAASAAEQAPALAANPQQNSRR